MHINLKPTENWRSGVRVSMVQGCCYPEGHTGVSWEHLTADTYLRLTVILTPVVKCAVGGKEIFSHKSEYPDSGLFLSFSF